MQTSTPELQNDNRAQLFLVAGITILIALVVVVLILNTVLFTSNIEARETLPEEDEANSHFRTLEREYRTTLQNANEGNYATKEAARENITNALFAVNTQTGKLNAVSSGVYTTIEPVKMSDATLARQTNADCTFESAKADCEPGANHDPESDYTYTPGTPQAGDVTEFNATQSGDSDGGITTYEWDFNNDGTVDATGELANHTYSTPGMYIASLTVTDAEGATDTTEKTIHVENSNGNQLPVSAFKYEPRNPLPNEQVTIDAASSYDPDGTISSYEWDFNSDGTPDSTGETVTHTFSATGTYEVTLTTTDSDGDSTTTTKNVEVNSFNTGTRSPPPFQVENSLVSTINWDLATTSEVRQFQFEITRDNMPTTIGTGDITDQAVLRMDSFYVETWGQNGNSHYTYIYTSTDNEIVVSTQKNNGPIKIKYREQVQNATIDITTGEINGKYRNITFGEGVSKPYTISFRNGDLARGQYKLLIPESPSAATSIAHGNFNDYGSTKSPYLSYGIYSIRVRTTYDVDDFHFESTFSIAPDTPVK